MQLTESSVTNEGILDVDAMNTVNMDGGAGIVDDLLNTVLGAKDSRQQTEASATNDEMIGACDVGDDFKEIVVKIMTIIFYMERSFAGKAPVAKGVTYLLVAIFIGLPVAMIEASDQELALQAFFGMLLLPWYILFKFCEGKRWLGLIMFAFGAVGIALLWWFWGGCAILLYVLVTLITLDWEYMWYTLDTLLDDAQDRAEYWWNLFHDDSYGYDNVGETWQILAGASQSTLTD